MTNIYDVASEMAGALEKAQKAIPYYYNVTIIQIQEALALYSSIDREGVAGEVPAGVGETPCELVESKLRGSTDASVWAQEFCNTGKRIGVLNDDIDVGWVLGWFANAMCAQMDASEARMDKQEAISQALFALLDDIDTMDDIAKCNDPIYRTQVRRIHAKRFDYGKTDGYIVEWLDAPLPERNPETVGKAQKGVSND